MIYGWTTLYVPQNIVILDDDIKNNITLFNTFREFDQKHYEDVIKLSQLSEVEKNFLKGNITM